MPTDPTPKRGPGRPKRSEERASPVYVEVTPDERAEIVRRAAAAGLKLAEYARRKMLGKRLPKVADAIRQYTPTPPGGAS